MRNRDHRTWAGANRNEPTERRQERIARSFSRRRSLRPYNYDNNYEMRQLESLAEDNEQRILALFRRYNLSETTTTTQHYQDPIARVIVNLIGVSWGLMKIEQFMVQQQREINHLREMQTNATPMWNPEVITSQPAIQQREYFPHSQTLRRFY